MIQKYSRVIVAVALLIILCVALALATYTVKPGQTALLLRGGKIVAVVPTAGLHWKLPLVHGVLWLDTRSQLSEGEVRASAESDQGLVARYLVVWRIAEPERFYAASGGDSVFIRKQLDAAFTPVLQQAMAAGSAEEFLAGPTAPLLSDLMVAAEAVAKKTGITLLDVKLGAAELPAQLAANAATTMAAGIRAEIVEAKAAGTAARQTVAAQAGAKAARILAKAKQQAATITGKSQARVAALYAPVAKQAPEFFRYFLSLQSEADALKQHTRVLVISMDSPWFKALEDAAEHPTQ